MELWQNMGAGPNFFPMNPMSPGRVDFRGACRAARSQWRPFLLGVLMVFLVALTCYLYLHGSERAERAALAMGGTFIGMLGVAWWVCRR